MPTTNYALSADLPPNVVAVYDEDEDGNTVIIGNRAYLSEAGFRAEVAAHGEAMDVGARKAPDPR